MKTLININKKLITSLIITLIITSNMIRAEEQQSIFDGFRVEKKSTTQHKQTSKGFFPIYWNDTYLYIFPIYFQDEDGWILAPVAWHLKKSRGILPIWYKSKNHHYILPLWYQHKNRWLCLPLGYKWNETSHLGPIYWNDKKHAFFLIYSKTKEKFNLPLLLTNWQKYEDKKSFNLLWKLYATQKSKKEKSTTILYGFIKRQKSPKEAYWKVAWLPFKLFKKKLRTSHLKSHIEK